MFKFGSFLFTLRWEFRQQFMVNDNEKEIMPIIGKIIIFIWIHYIQILLDILAVYLKWSCLNFSQLFCAVLQ